MMQVCAFLPQLQVDETIYSWCATIHAMSGSRSTQEWSRSMLGADHAPRQLDLPAYLPRLLRTAQLHLSLEEALRQHTTAGMFMPFVKPDLVARLRVSIDAPPVEWPHAPQVMRKVLFCHSRTLSWSQELRYCPECVKADVSRIGRSYWHTHHQWPLSRRCAMHRTGLVTVNTSTKTWHLPPSSIEGLDPVDAKEEHRDVQSTVQMVADAFSNLESVNTKILRASALLRLKALGVIHSIHAVRHARLHAWYRSQPVASWLAGESSGLASLADPEWIPKLLWRRTQDHPIRWIILWSTLGWADERSAVSSLNAALTGPACDEQGQQLLFEPKDSGIATNTVEPTPPAFQHALTTATSYAELMQLLRASRGDVVRWLEADPIARATWRKRLQQARITAAQQAITQLICNSPAPSRREISREASKEVRLLRHRAPQLLDALLNAVPSDSDAQRPLWLELPLN